MNIIRHTSDLKILNLNLVNVKGAVQLQMLQNVLPSPFYFLGIQKEEEKETLRSICSVN